MTSHSNNYLSYKEPGNGKVAFDPSEEERLKSTRHKSKLDTYVIQTEREFDDIAGAWNQLLNKSSARIFQTYEWQRLWWDYFSNEDKLNIITFYHGDQLVGVAPFVLRETPLLFGYVHRKLQIMASYIPPGGLAGAYSHYGPSDYLDLIMDPAYAEDVAGAFVYYLGENRACFDEIVMNELSDDSMAMQYVFPKLKESDLPMQREQREKCPRIDLPDTMDDYLYMVSRSIRYKLRKARRAVTQKNLYDICDIRNESEFESTFDSLVKLHQDRWNKQGYPGAFADNRVEGFLRSVSKAFYKQGWLKLKSAKDKQGNYLAVDLAYVFKKQVYNYQRAFDVTSDLARHRPGFSLGYYLIESAINEGSKVFDMLRGDERYKLRLSTSVVQNWKVTINNIIDRDSWKQRLYKVNSLVTEARLRIAREILLLRIHVREWGFTGFIPKYINFIKNRLENKNE